MKKRKKTSARIIREALVDLVSVWRETLKRPRRRVWAAALTLAFVVAMLVARVGTARARLGAGVLLCGAVAAAVHALVVQGRRWGEPRVVIRRIAWRADPERAERALRALSLLDEDGEPTDPSTSAVLARLHVARQLAALPHDRIVLEADRSARRIHVAAAALAVVALGLGGTHAFGVIEGADVLFAMHGTAPVGLPYVRDPMLTVRPPDYLHEDERSVMAYGARSLPRGTLITFRGEAIHAGRRLVLTDGTSEVPFVDDGNDKVVARWPLQESVALRIAARFGDVVIDEPDATTVTSIADDAPLVKLDGAPKTIALTSPEGKNDLPIRYEATDDHGLKEVHLVLRCGTREERRVLAKLDGDAREDRGGAMLHPWDAFIRGCHEPVAVRVEAKDNDAVTGPKWGFSESFTLLPPDVGEAQAARLDGLRALRDAYVDTLAWRMENAPGKSPTFLDDEKKGADDVASTLDRTLLVVTRLPSRLVTLLRTRQKRVEDALTAERRAPTAASHRKTVQATETMVLVIDGVIRGLGYKDARAASKQLADVADTLALALDDDRTRPSPQATTREDASIRVLEGGQKRLVHLGPLGRDLANVVRSGLARVARGRGEKDMPHAVLAARDLADRLREADPSFGARGSSGGHATGEAGSGPSSGDEGSSDEPSEAEQAFNEAAQDLEQLSQDHAGAMGKVDQALSRKLGEDDLKALRDEAKPHAAAVRDAIKDLPSVGGGSDTWTSKGAAARELGEQMARSLEGGSPDDAVQSGKRALEAIDEAKRIAARERYHTYDDQSGDAAQKQLDDAHKKLEPEVKWAEDQLRKLKKMVAERAGSELEKSGAEEEQLAERARKLAERSRDKGALPDPALDALEEADEAARQAAQALQRGDAELGSAKQREAQHKLDAAKQALGGDTKDEGEMEDGNGARAGADHFEIPDKQKGPEEFRRRVLKGLSEPASSKDKEAITRYAEGLLR